MKTNKRPCQLFSTHVSWAKDYLDRTVSLIKKGRHFSDFSDVLLFFSVFVGLPQVLQKNMGLFSFLSQLAHFGNSSQVDSTRKRSKWSEGGSEWPSRRGVNFLQKRISILAYASYFSPKPKPFKKQLLEMAIRINVRGYFINSFHHRWCTVVAKGRRFHYINPFQ